MLRLKGKVYILQVRDRWLKVRMGRGRGNGGGGGGTKKSFGAVPMYLFLQRVSRQTR